MGHGDLHAGFDTYFPGCDKYYQQEAHSFKPYATGGLLKSWQPRDPRLEDIERQRRAAPTSIEEACAYGSLAHLITFWAQGQNVKNRMAVYEGIDATPLMWAAFRGHLHVARFLIDQGVDVNATNSAGHSALSWALMEVQYEMVRFLLDHGADPLKKDQRGYNAYFLAVQSNSLPLLLMVCECCPLDVQDRDDEGHSLLQWAAYVNSPAICQYLVEKCHMGMDFCDKDGRTPLVWAAREGYAEVVEYLVTHGARTEVADVDGYTALQYARYRNHRECVYVLTQHPAARRNDVTASVEGESSRHRLLPSGYTGVQQLRRRGTLAMMFHQPFFLFMSIAGAVYVALAYLIIMLLPPIISHVVIGLFYFRNVLWMIIAGSPVQGGQQEPTALQKSGIASNFADSVRGIWVFRNRDAACLFALTAFIIVQLHAWAKLGLSPLLLFYPNETVALKGRGTEGVYQSGEYWWSIFFHTKAEFEQFILLFLVCLIAVSAIFCKLLSMRSVHEPVKSSLDTSPLWTILKQRAYRWLHPRILCVRLHTAIPLRAFYCYERDVIMRRFDSYSVALDCPVAESNHVWFFLFANGFACFQWLIFFWAWEQTSELLQCPASPYFGRRLFWSLWNLLIHGLPCRDTAQSVGTEWGPYLSWLQYIIPTSANYLGVWLLQFSLVASVMATFVAARQWTVALTGATRMELANPTATSSDGGLVTIFPQSLSAAEPWQPPLGITEGITPAMEGGEAARAPARRGPRCIYASSGFSVVNAAAFLLGYAGRRWRGAMAISPSNTPMFSVSLLSEGGDV
ncbi:putative 6-phosphofructo-2-kinase/fructose-2,6-biphosphatase [Trypanosoma grayi]|uniref:putative 6-phosphofructo-2-kinase/fructose-2,6-biphosphatase n=1 Tax=Trypanosoma grayi TaxID=71804 RepID=UPI0004F48131|nr:putative 6-phosphofructo-2-kinase/fructose-2,6-biphosphatase [Trypanosoma grayi]KEG15557.1 putative 6-phosphofructo-2-kinase/fructose-2,6-biphosphatase [Trypanosoma grayi]